MEGVIGAVANFRTHGDALSYTQGSARKCGREVVWSADLCRPLPESRADQNSKRVIGLRTYLSTRIVASCRNGDSFDSVLYNTDSRG